MEAPSPQKALSLILVAAMLTGTAPSREVTISTSVKVNVLATVREKNGNIVRDCKQENFHLDRGRWTSADDPVLLPESDLPLTLGLLVDTSLSHRHVQD